MRSDVVAKTAENWSNNGMGKFAGGPGSAMQAFLSRLAFQDYQFFFDDFDGDAINLDYWALNSDTNAADFVHNAQANGVVRGATSANDNEATSMLGPAIYFGDRNCWMEVRFKIDTITNVQFEVGFVDAVTDKTLEVVTDVDTPAVGNGAGDVAVIHMDTDQTLTTAAFVTEGSTASQDPTATTLDPAFTPTAATYHTVRIGVAGNVPFFLLDGSEYGTEAHGNAVASQIEGGTALAPWIFVMARSAADRLFDVDYVAFGQDRATR